MDLLANFTANTVIFMLVALGIVLLILAALSWRNPVLAKIGLRNIRRRPGQSALIVLGLTLSTVIIIAAFGVGDTLRYSVQRQGRDNGRGWPMARTARRPTSCRRPWTT